MGILKDVIDVVGKEMKDGAVDFTLDSDTRRFSSIAKRSKEGTMQFPHIVSRDLDIDTIRVLTSANERNYASFAQIVITMNPETNENDLAEYLNQFHQNSDTTTDINDVIHGMKGIGENFQIDSLLVYSPNNKLASVLEANLVFEDSFNGCKLNDMFTPVVEANTARKLSNNQPPKSINVKIDANTGGGDIGGTRKATEWVPRSILSDNDVKKSNELVPTMLHIRVLKSTKDSNEKKEFIDFIIGVKATIHPVSSEEMIENVLDACKNHDAIFKFIKWTTGEIDFVKDLLLNIGESKKDVTARSAGGSSWWIALKRRRLLAKVKNTLRLKQLLPNATIVMSMNEVDQIKANYGFDLTDPIFVRKIMQKYFLLGFVIADPATEIAQFLYDGNDNFQSLTFAGLEKENSNAARSFKDIMKAVQRI